MIPRPGHDSVRHMAAFMLARSKQIALTVQRLGRKQEQTPGYFGPAPVFPKPGMAKAHYADTLSLRNLGVPVTGCGRIKSTEIRTFETPQDQIRGPAPFLPGGGEVPMAARVST